MAFRSTNEGFMETTRYATYYEDNYTKFKNKDDFVEAHDFDVCEDSSEEDRDNPKTKHKRRHIDSYGSIKKPTYKPRVERTPEPTYKTSPNRNSRHSIRLASESSDEDEQIEHLSSPTTQLSAGSAKPSSTEAFAADKAWQHRLSGQARFDNVRRQRAADRLRLHHACQQARKTKERALRDAETAAACLVQVVPTSTSFVQTDISEAPIEFIDLTRQDAHRKEKKPVTKPWPRKKNWKGEDVDLTTGDAYVLLMV